ncbi:MAG: sulfate adenylyltransferase, partial [Acidimicrobiia bacterium]|nr:sulfate adenylyltransferase [Acidimicrobiia bacterium]
MESPLRGRPGPRRESTGTRTSDPGVLVSEIIAPHGGELVDLLVDEARATELKEGSLEFPSWDLTDRQVCDLELLVNGSFSPLRGFLGRSDYESVVADMRLADGTLWPMPITLDISEEAAEGLAPGMSLALRDAEGVMLAVVAIDDVWRPDKEAEAKGVFGTTSTEHPGVAYLMNRAGPIYIGGRVEGVQLPVHYDFHSLRKTPAQVRAEFAANGWDRVVAFQTRNPMHRAHVELTMRAAASTGAHLLIHPVVGMTKPGDVDHYTRVRVYQAIQRHFPEEGVGLSLLNLAMRMGGPREAVWHAIIRKNHGVTHFIVGRDHAGPGKDSTGTPFYGPYEAQDMVLAHESELGVTLVPFKQMVFVPSQDTYMPTDEVPAGTDILDISGTQLREKLATGAEIPEWFSFPEVVAELRRTHRP